MMKLYKHAYTCFHACKKDFQVIFNGILIKKYLLIYFCIFSKQSDEAWNYYAGATEMAALSLFMLNDPSKKYPPHYMEDCIMKYLQICQMPEFAVRATLFDALCLKSLGM